MSALAPTLQAFFTDRLIRQRHASPHTIAAYRDTLRLLLGFASQRTGIPPSRLDLDDLDAPLIAGFLDHLETERGNSVRTRNARLAAIHSLFRYAALHPPRTRRHHRHGSWPSRPNASTGHWSPTSTEPEVDALLAACDRRTWTGRRDHALLLLAVQTGLRISELTGLTRADVHLGAGAHVGLPRQGPQRPDHPADRRPPSPSCGTGSTSNAGDPTDPLFPTRRGQARSAATRSSTASPTTPPRRPPSAHRCTARRSPRTSCGTPPRCGCCTPASTPPSSPSGSATSASTPPRSTCTPTCNLKEQALARTRPPNGRHRPIPPTRHPARLARSALIMPTSPARTPCRARDPASTSA